MRAVALAIVLALLAVAPAGAEVRITYVPSSESETPNFTVMGDDAPNDLRVRCTGGRVEVVGVPGPSVPCDGTFALVVHGRGGADAIDLSGMIVKPELEIDAQGGADVDRVTGSPFEDRIWGDDAGGIFENEGGDVLRGGNGNDLIRGGPGGDEIHGEGGEDVITPGADNDRVFGGPGRDQMLDDGDFRERGPTTNDTLDGGLGHDSLSGGPGHDRLLGQAGSDGLFGGSGNDRLLGHAGRDYMTGGAGSDLLDGGVEADQLFGNSGLDRLFGRAGNDRLTGGPGRDVLSGGPGRNRLVQ